MTSRSPLKYLAAVTAFLFTAAVNAQAPQATDRAKEVAATKAFWTAERIASAQPRDFVIDSNGLAYMTDKQGRKIPYGHSVPFKPIPMAKGGGGGKTSGSGGSGRDTGTTTGGLVDVSNAEWTDSGYVQHAAGRLLFWMDGAAYVCSGTLVNTSLDDSERSIVLTAAHCVYDDREGQKKFAELAIFIPNQASTKGVGTDVDCSNDPNGCWVADFGVVDTDWTTSVFPGNIPWDYAYYVFGTDEVTETFSLKDYKLGQQNDLNGVIPHMLVSFADAEVPAYTRALGYSYKDDPHFMYCGEAVTGSSYEGLLLPSCALSGGASGGPWSQSTELDLGTGPIISVNSYGPARGPKYMGGPKLSGNSAACLFDLATNANAVDSLDSVSTAYSYNYEYKDNGFVLGACVPKTN